MKLVLFILSIFSFPILVFADNCQEPRIQFEQRKERAEKLLQSSYDVGQLPRPMQSEYNCMGSTLMAARDFQQIHQAEIYNMQLNNSELESIASLQGLQDTAATCGFETDLKDIIGKLNNRMNNKATDLARQIQQEKNYGQYQGIMTATLKTAYAREQQGDGNTAFAKYQAKMMSLELVDFALSELQNSHDFQYDLTAVIQLANVAITLGGTTTDEIIKRFEKLYKFHVELLGDVEVEIDGEQISYQSELKTPRLEGHYNAEAFRFDFEPMPADFKFKGQISVDDGEGTVSPNFYKSPVNIEVKACELIPTVKVKVLKFGPDQESWKLCADGECHSFFVPTTMQSLVHMSLESQYRFEPHESGDPWYVFYIEPFHNKSAILGEKTFQGNKQIDDMVIDSEYSFKVQHTP